MKILFTICGRAGSKGIKNKNIRDFLGKPLPLYTLSTIDIFSRKNPDIECDVAVNTDSPELENIFKASNMKEVEFVTRKEDLAGDSVAKMAVIKDSLESKEAGPKKYDMVIDLDITSPLRRASDLQNVYEKMLEEDFDVVFTVAESRRNPYFNMVKKNENGYFERVIQSNFTARQQAPEIFDMNASIYAYRPEFLRSTTNLFEGKCGVVKMYDTGILDLDHESDFEVMEIIGSFLFNNKKEFKEIFDNIR